jgi:hypothetical protein
VRDRLRGQHGGAVAEIAAISPGPIDAPASPRRWLGGGGDGMADAFKCPKCGKTSPKFTNCCGTPMKKNG